MDVPARNRTSSAPDLKGEQRPALASREAASDRQVLATLYREHGDQLTAYLRKAFGDGPPDPADVTQEAFRKLLEQNSLSRIENIRAFLWRTARNLVLNQKRNIATRSSFDYEIEHLFFAIEGPASTPERVLEMKEQLTIIAEALKNMPERRRKAFLWNRVEGLNLTAVGKRLGITRRAVARHVAQAAYDLETALQKPTGGRG
ncbi:MAG: sigma-70 family RNA polymerase sigma factor [Pseudomonadota bacterium]